MMEEERKHWNPVLAGIGVGLIMLLTYYTAGRGFGTTGGLTRLVLSFQNWLMPDLTAQSEYFARYLASGNVLDTYLVYMLAGIVLGAFVAAAFGNDLRLEILRGPRIGAGKRLAFALIGGALVGFAARLARGCMSGQALVGAAELSVGSWAFLICVFIGGFAVAPLVRRQWL
jgi:uncharacterized membrane protein YedE/YeeE